MAQYNKEKLESIAKSMKGIGHRNPISVRAIKNGFRLITGRHRLEAAKKLEWKRINAIVMRGDKLDQRIWRTLRTSSVPILRPSSAQDPRREWRKI